MNILLVEDESGIANFIQQGLEENGFRVKVTDEGIEGLELALTGKYELLLLDWMLPGINGIEICKQFREKFSNIPIIFLTAKDTVEDTIVGLQAGLTIILKNPFTLKSY